MSRRPPNESVSTFSEREYEVLQLMAKGLANRGIADRLVVAERTVAGHVGKIFGKLGIDNGTSAKRRVFAALRYLCRRTPA